MSVTSAMFTANSYKFLFLKSDTIITRSRLEGWNERVETCGTTG
jgi:hypothetical protein